MSLDVLTPKGMEAVHHAFAASIIWADHYPNQVLYQTPQTRPAIIDGMIVKKQTIVAAVEIKARDMRLDDLRTKFRNEWLVTAEKVDRAIEIAKALTIPMIGWLYMIPEQTLLAVMLSQSDGTVVAKMRRERTETQATVNGGKASRMNCFISMDDAEILK